VLARWDLALRLYDLRRRAGLKGDQAAKLLKVSPSMVSRAENPARQFSITHAGDMAELYGRHISRKPGGTMPRDEIQLVKALIQGASAPAWWDAYVLPDTLPDDHDSVGLEQGATSIGHFAVNMPQLLQTAVFAEVAVGVSNFGPGATKDWVKRLMVRQLALNTLDYQVVLDESVLYRGHPAIMRDQLGHLLALSRAHKVLLQVLPFEAGLMVPGDIQYLRLPDEMPSLVVLSSPLEIKVVDEVAPLRAYGTVLAQAQAQAFDSEESARLIEERVKQLDD
jgi:transcriptional regulator with XRE-family HTH domain